MCVLCCRASTSASLRPCTHSASRTTTALATLAAHTTPPAARALTAWRPQRAGSTSSMCRGSHSWSPAGGKATGKRVHADNHYIDCGAGWGGRGGKVCCPKASGDVRRGCRPGARSMLGACMRVRAHECVRRPTKTHLLDREVVVDAPLPQLAAVAAVLDASPRGLRDCRVLERVDPRVQSCSSAFRDEVASSDGDDAHWRG